MMFTRTVMHLPLIVAVLIVIYKDAESMSIDHVCRSAACVEYAKDLSNSLNKSVNPCEDFYGFVCGGWIRKHPLPEDKTAISSFSLADERLQTTLRSILENNTINEAYSRKVNTYYKACLNLAKINRRSSKPLSDVLSHFGAWPVINESKWTEKRMDWLDTIVELRRLGMNINAMLAVYVDKDFKNNSINVIYIDQPILALPNRAYYTNGFNDSVYTAYYKLMVKSARLLGANVTQLVESDLKDVLSFETTMAEISTPNEQRRDYNEMYNEYTKAELIEEGNNLRFGEYFDRLLDIEIDENERFIVVEPEYISKFNSLMAKTDQKLIANYLLWRAIYSSIPHLSNDWMKIYAEFKKVLYGQKKMATRADYCLSLVRNSMDFAFSALFTQRYGSVETKDKVTNIVDFINNETIETIVKSVWMQNQTKSNAILKAKETLKFVAFANGMRYPKFTNDYYEKLHLTDNHYENVFLVEKFGKDKQFQKLRKLNKRNEWTADSSVAIVNAFNDFTANSIYIPQGILQSPFFDKNWPNYLNFGGIGSVIGHEITHGFDDQGRQFDKNGNLNDWWDTKTDEVYRQKSQCVVKQYSGYAAPEVGLNVNGVNTQGENIADIGGFKLAYKSYKKWEKINGIEKRMPSLDYTSDQMFWINVAHSWCTKISTEALRNRIHSDPHSPAMFRVNGALADIQEFSDSFQCSKRSRMNPEKKCVIW